MVDSTDDESSDSSDEFLVSPDKINLQLDSTFFTKQCVPNLRSKQATEDESDDDDDDFKNVTDNGSTELFSEVLKNLENTKANQYETETTVSCQSTSNISARDRPTSTRQSSVQNILSNEINDLLLQGETGGSTLCDANESHDKEDIEDIGTNEYTIPQEGVNITLPGTSYTFNKRKRGTRDLDTFVKDVKNRIRANQILIHKVGLLCWLGYGCYLNRLINDTEIMSSVSSLVSQNNYPPACVNIAYLGKFTKWFKKMFAPEPAGTEKTITKQLLLSDLKQKKVSHYKELILLYIAMLRAIGLNSRLLISLDPPDLKIRKDQFSNVDPKKEKVKDPTTKSNLGARKPKKKISKPHERTLEDNSSKIVPENSPEGQQNAMLAARRKAAAILQVDTSKKKKAKVVSSDTAKVNDVNVEKDEPVSMARKLRNRIVQSTNFEKKEDNAMANNKASSIHVKKTKVLIEAATDSEEEFVPKRVKKPKIQSDKKLVTKCNTVKKKDETTTYHDDQDEDKKRITEDMWVEVYVESEQKWICASIMHEEINCVTKVYSRAKKPVLYIIAWNSDGSIKDVTRRYCPHWLTVTRKQRVEEKWWTESLLYLKEKETSISKAEDEMLLQKELEQPLPKTIAECKGHPLYVLTRHLLKYEALYPPECVPLGHLHTGEAIYSRYCVHTLCSRETWIKKARVVKPAQEPYKIVKALPKYDKLSGMKLKDCALELFGEWQTTEYVPPVAKDGIVPRNEYGNVDLFKQSMLPKGTVHIDLPGLNRVARKLNIDCATAVVGFKFGCMGAVPAFEGFVVCEEYEDTLREAWEAEQIEAAKRAREKREKRIYGNWKKLIRGLFVREKLAAKYEFQDEEKCSASNKRSKQRKVDEKKLKP